MFRHKALRCQLELRALRRRSSGSPTRGTAASAPGPRRPHRSWELTEAVGHRTCATPPANLRRLQTYPKNGGSDNSTARLAQRHEKARLCNARSAAGRMVRREEQKLLQGYLFSSRRTLFSTPPNRIELFYLPVAPPIPVGGT